MSDAAVPTTEEDYSKSHRDTHYLKQARRAVAFRESSHSFGAGTPYPSTPRSESTYNGSRSFDDCELWTLR